MKKQHIILAVNLGVLLLYTVLVRSSVQGSEKELAILIISGFLILGHVIVNLALAAVLNRHRKPFLLSALLVLLIGFSTCFYSASIS
jgi:hypothetical protein